MQLVTLLDYFGTVVFAFTGALVAGRRRMDLFGIALVGLVTAVGGGSLRDVLIGVQPVFWVAAPIYLLVALGGVAPAFALLPVMREPESQNKLVLLADAVGLSAFTVIGAQKALLHGIHPGVAILMGVFTAVMGGVFRDVLCNEIPLILRKEIYATACLFGASIFVALRGLQIPLEGAMLAGGLATLTIRMLAVHYRLSLPQFTAPKEP